MPDLLKIPASAPLPGAGALTWLTLKQASRLSGLSDGHLRRECFRQWLGDGKARRIDSKGTWQVRSDAHPSFTISPPAPILASVEDLRQVSAAARAKAQERARILTEWQRYIAHGTALGQTVDDATDAFVAAMPDASRVSRRTLYNWNRDFLREGLSGVIDRRATPGTAAAQANDPFLAEILRLWNTQQQRKVMRCYDIALAKAQDMGWKICSGRTARRFIEAYARANPATTILGREGPAAFTDKVEPYITRDYSTIASNEIWNADHHVCDVLVRVGESKDPNTGEVTPIFRRPWLTAWQDLRSRKIVGWVIRDADPNTEAILEAFYVACSTHGVPLAAYTDNGKDFDSRAFTGLSKKERREARKTRVTHDQNKLGGIYAALRIKHMHAWIEHGQSKPIERFFGTMEDGFGRFFDTYCGRSPQDKPEQLADMLARGKAPTLEEFVEKFAAWVEGDYHAKTHTGDSMDVRPNDAWTDNLISQRTAPDELLKILVQPRIGPLTVTQNGVRHKHISYGAGDLNHLLGQEVYIRRDHRDVSRVSVWTLDDKPIATVRANVSLPVNADGQLVELAIKDKLRRTKALKGATQARLRMAEDITDTMYRINKERAQKAANASGGGDEPPPSLSPVRSDLEGALPFLQNQQQQPLRRAVGASDFDLAAAMQDTPLTLKRPAPLPSLSELLGDD